MNLEEYSKAYNLLRQEYNILIKKMENDPRYIAAQKECKEAEQKWREIYKQMWNEYGLDKQLDKEDAFVKNNHPNLIR